MFCAYVCLDILIYYYAIFMSVSVKKIREIMNPIPSVKMLMSLY